MAQALCLPRWHSCHRRRAQRAQILFNNCFPQYSKLDSGTAPSRTRIKKRGKGNVSATEIEGPRFGLLPDRPSVLAFMLPYILQFLLVCASIDRMDGPPRRRNRVERGNWLAHGKRRLSDRQRRRDGHGRADPRPRRSADLPLGGHRVLVWRLPASVLSLSMLWDLTHGYGAASDFSSYFSCAHPGRDETCVVRDLFTYPVWSCGWYSAGAALVSRRTRHCQSKHPRLPLSPVGIPILAAALFMHGAQIAFATTSSQKSLVVPSAGGPIRSISSGSYLEFTPSWSPDGRSLAVWRSLQPSLPNVGAFYVTIGALYITDSTTLKGELVPGSQGVGLPAWSPDGRYIAGNYAAQEVRVFDLRRCRWTVLASGTGLGTVSATTRSSE